MLQKQFMVNLGTIRNHTFDPATIFLIFLVFPKVAKDRKVFRFCLEQTVGIAEDCGKVLTFSTFCKREL